MNRLQFGLRTAVLLIGIILQQGCSTVTQTETKRSLGIVAQPQVTAITSPSPARLDINITQQEYENALAKWRMQGIVEYEITLVDSSRMVADGNMRLHIRVEGGEPRLLGYVRFDQGQPQSISLSSLDVYELEYLREFSVEAMFNHIGGLFNGVYANASAGGPVIEYNVAFHPSLGYTTHVYSRAFLREGGPPVSECCISYEVVGLNILESSTPGMPKTGNAGP